MNDTPKGLLLDQSEARCLNCGKVWLTSLSCESFTCMTCGHTIEPKKHVVVKDETEVN